MKNLTVIVILFILGLGSLVYADGGFTCCDETDSKCVYNGKLMQDNSYFKESGPCQSDHDAKLH